MARTGKRRKKPGRTRRDGRVSRERRAVRASAADGRETPPARGLPGRALARLYTAADALLHLRTPAEPVWKWFWPVLALAFAARAAIALYGDFVLHPDEIMQYLEQGHRLAFGNGVVYWEFFYGARPWMIPGLIAGVLALLDAVGLGEPYWYVGGVKLAFCAISLAIPAGMYFFARRHFDEAAARVALLAGAFWYELAGFAHKPMTEFTGAALSMALLALCVRPSRGDGPAAAWMAAFLAVLTAAIRIQYAPLALALLGLWFLRAGKAARVHATAAAIVFFFTVGAFDAVTWDGGWFHSYRTYLEFNLAIDRHAVEWVWPRYQYLVWLLFLGGGLSALCTGAALLDLRRYGFLLILLSLILVPHSIEEHKEYRYLFVLAPLWLLIGAGLVARLASRARWPTHPPDASSGSAPDRATGRAWIYATAGALFAAVSLAGALNLLPRWDEALTEKFSVGVRHPVRFLHGQDPEFAAYRWLAAAPGVKAVWDLDNDYLETPGYYYLHREIPFYDRQAGLANELHADLETLRASVSHLVTVRPDLAVPGYVVEKEFGRVRILRREENEAPVRGWRGFNPTVTNLFGEGYLRRLYAHAPPPPANFNIQFVEPE